MDDVTEERRRLHDKELYAVYSPDIIRVITSIRLRLLGHVAYMGKTRGAYRVLVGKPEGRRPSVHGRMILKWIFEKWDGGIDWIDLVQDRERWRLFRMR